MMYQNYLKIAFQNLIKNKLYSAINIFGLAVGLTTCVIILLFVRNELSFDQFWEKSDKIARINTSVIIPNRAPFVSVSAPAPLKETIENFFQNEVVRATRFIPMHPIVKLGDKIFAEDMHWTDPETAEMFNLNIVKGDIKAALKDKTSLAVDESFAEKYFDDEDPIGKILNIKVYDIERDYQIAAVFEDLPENSSLNFKVLARFDFNDFPNFRGFFDTWLNLGEHLLYVEFKSADMFKTVEDRLGELVDTHAIIFDSIKPSPDTPNSEIYIQTVQPLEDIHLNPSGMGEMKASGDINIVRTFMVTAALVLLIACINYMNLATAKSTGRAREVALRKVLGATRGNIIAQFLGESVIIALIGLGFSLIFIEMSLPYFNEFLNFDLQFSIGEGFTFFILTGFVVAVGIIAGLYPAMVLSGFLPAETLAANKSSQTRGSVGLRNVLVVFQFVISISLIIATATVYSQTQYVMTKDLGFNKQNILILNNINAETIAPRQEGLKQALLALPQVTNASFTSYSPIDIHERIGLYKVKEGEPNQSAMISGQAVDHDFLDTYKIPLVAGRFYDRAYGADGMPAFGSPPQKQSLTGTIVINKEAVRQLGLKTPEEAIGRHLSQEIGPGLFLDLEIIGVTRNIYFQSPKKPLRAEIYTLSPGGYAVLGLRFSGSPQNIVSKVEKTLGEFTSDVPFQFEFSDKTIESEFQNERNLSIVLTTFSLIIVAVACLGLYGLAGFTAEQRTKEIAIRKVLGASVSDIVRLLLWQFSKPVLIANLIAWPITVWGMLGWLESFPIRIEAWALVSFCLVSGFIVLLIALGTVGGNTARVAAEKPIKALRCE